MMKNALGTGGESASGVALGGFPKQEINQGHGKTLNKLPDVTPENLKLTAVKEPRIIRKFMDKKGRVTKTITIGGEKEDKAHW